jgi:MFS family permease
MEARVISKVSPRIVPFVALCYFVCYLDRVNVGFAALQMNSDLGFTATVFGWGAGIFFFGYFFFEVPSNLALERFGARLWIARIMVTWGLLSAAMALIWNETSFLVVRFLLGAAEAGFFPGIILFLTYWFPAAYRARMVGRFMVAIPISGAPRLLCSRGTESLQTHLWREPDSNSQSRVGSEPLSDKQGGRPAPLIHLKRCERQGSSPRCSRAVAHRPERSGPQRRNAR